MFIPKLDKLFETTYGTKLPSIIELQEKTAIAFVSTTPVFDLPQPLPENVIPVGGVHIRDPKPLPKVNTTLGSCGRGRFLSFKDSLI